MGIPWEQAYRIIPDLDSILEAQGGPRKPAGPVAGVPACVHLEASPGRWRVSIAYWCPASDNVRARGLKRWIAAKKADREVIRTWVAEHARVPRATGRRRVSVEVAKRGPRPDGTNLWKSLADGLVNTGLLVNDSPDWFEAGPIVVSPASTGDVTTTTLLIEDLP